MSIAERVVSFHADRDPERVALKFGLLATSANAFFRGTAFLFYGDLVKGRSALPESPLAWITGDAHLENYGVYKGDNRLVYFDFNDFDEATLAPVLWDLARMLTGVFLAADALRLSLDEAGALVKTFAEDYAAELGAGKPRWVERATAKDGVRDLVYSLKGRSRKDFLKRRTKLKNGRRALRTDGKYGLPLLAGEWETLQSFSESFGAEMGQPAFFRLLGASRRIAGNGSLGSERFALLVEGKGTPDLNYLLDLKLARPSVVAAELSGARPPFDNEALRIVTIQRRMQAISPAFLHSVTVAGKSYMLRELVPREDRVRVASFADNPLGLRQLLRTEAHVLAWAHLRSSGRRGSAPADELIDLGLDCGWRPRFIEYARGYAETIKGDWRLFAKAAERGLPQRIAPVAP